MNYNFNLNLQIKDQHLKKHYKSRIDLVETICDKFELFEDDSDQKKINLMFDIHHKVLFCKQF